MQRWLRPGSVAAQVTLLVMGLLVFMGAVNWLLAGYTLHRVLVEEARRHCLLVARAAAAAMAAQGPPAAEAGAESPRLLGAYRPCRFAILDAAGRVVARSEGWPGVPGTKGDASALAAVAPEPVPGAGLRVVADLEAEEALQGLGTFNRQTMVVSTASLLLAAAASWLLARRLLLPVRDLVRGLRSVARGDFDVEIPARGGEEWRHLIHTFNRMVAEVRAYNRDLERRARQDSLTGLLNRGSLEEELAWAVRRAHRAGERVSLLMIDIDHFKAYNDEFGHQAGDEILRRCADVVREVVRERDLVGRYGGEELMVILPGAGCAEAAAVAERIRAAVAGREWPYRPVTLSVGVACFPDHADSPELLVARADAALYAAKARGRNTVVVWSSAGA